MNFCDVLRPIWESPNCSTTFCISVDWLFFESVTQWKKGEISLFWCTTKDFIEWLIISPTGNLVNISCHLPVHVYTLEFDLDLLIFFYYFSFYLFFIWSNILYLVTSGTMLNAFCEGCTWSVNSSILIDPLVVLNVVFFLQIWVSVLITNNNLNSAHNQTKMNVHLLWGQMKLNRQYVNFLYLVVTNQVSRRVSCNEHCTLAKVLCLVWHWCERIVNDKLILNHVWWHTQFALFVRLTRWGNLLNWS